MKKSFIFITLFVLLFASCATAGTETTIEEEITGKVIPDFKTQTTQGTFRLSEVLETNDFVLINFWGGSCVPCKKALPVLESLSKKYEGKIAFISLSQWNDTMATAKEVAKTYGVTYPVGIDTANIHEYRDTEPVPGFFLVDKNRVVVWERLGAPLDEEYYIEVFNQFLK